MDDPYRLNGEHIADRLMRQQALQPGSLPLKDEPAPTKRQVAAVMHALADFTLQHHMLGEEVLALGDDRRKASWDGPAVPNRDDRREWARAVGIGRLFHGIGDELEEQAFTEVFKRERLGTWTDEESVGEIPAGGVAYQIDPETHRPAKPVVRRVAPGRYEV